jgi:hypothetical protein
MIEVSFAGLNYLSKMFRDKRVLIETSTGYKRGRLLQLNGDIVELEVSGGVTLFLMPDKITSICEDLSPDLSSPQNGSPRP